MRQFAVPALVLAGLLAGGSAASAQQPPSLQGGFSVEKLLFELSLFMPERQGAPGAFGGGGAGGGGMGGGAGGTARQGGAGGGQGAPFHFNRDPALSLTGDQIAKILPIMNDLKASAFPTPSRAKTIQAGVDGVLTKAQKAGWDKLLKDLEKARGDSQGQGGQGQGGGRNFATMTPEEQKQLLDRLPEDQRKAFQERMKAAQAEAKLTPEQRRVRQIDRFIKELEDRAAELKKT
jgi:hypothetical protein